MRTSQCNLTYCAIWDFKTLLGFSVVFIRKLNLCKQKSDIMNVISNSTHQVLLYTHGSGTMGRSVR